MTFQNPSALLWAIPLFGIVIALYLLRMRRRDVKVPATFLWPERVEEIRANSLFQKLRFSWLLVLQLLAIAATVVALARPQTRQEGLSGEVTVFVLDSSASMQATDVPPSRFIDAKNQIRDAIRAAHPGDRLALIDAGPIPRVVFSLSGDSAHQIHDLDAVAGTDAEGDLGSALRLASALVGGIDGARIVLLSDGCFPPITDFSAGKASLIYRRVGASGRNLSITALGVSETPKARLVYCGVRNYGLDARTAVVTLEADGKVIDSVDAQIAGSKSWGRTHAIPLDAKIVSARIESQDDSLAADNAAYCLAQDSGHLRVLLVSAGDFFLERALALDPRVTLDKALSVPDAVKGKSGQWAYDLVIFDGVEEVPVRARCVLTLGRAGESSPVHKIGELGDADFLDAKDHAIMQGVDFEGLYIDKAEQVKPIGSAEVIAEAKGEPLVVARGGSPKQVYVAFSPLDSDLPLQVAFPILVANLLTYFGSADAADDIVVNTGRPFNVVTPTDNVTLVRPDGSNKTLEPFDGVATVRDTDRVGKYILEVGSKRRQVFAQLCSERESNIEPVDQLQIGGGKVKPVAAPARFADFWRPLVILCLLLLAGEWLLFARRS